MIPYVIAQRKKYDNETGQWVEYDTLSEYMADYFDLSYINRAVEEGVYSESEYNELMQNIYKLKAKNIIDEEAYDVLRKFADAYYGIRILAVNYNVSAEVVKDVTGRVFERIWDVAPKCLPLQDTLGFKTNHFASTYYAWMKNYNPCTEEVINN